MSEANYFDLFELETSYNLDKKLLDQKLFELQALFHPDKHVGHETSDQASMLVKSQELNYAYKILKSDYLRAEYILKLQGFDADKEQLSDEFLMETMQWREELNSLEEINQYISKTQESMGYSLNKGLYNEAKNDYIRLKFLKRFLEEKQNSEK